MSELMTTSNRRAIRWQLLSTASAMALLASVYTTGEVSAADNDPDRPTFWIELGGELQHVEGQGDNFPVGFLSTYPDSPVLQKVTPLQAQNPPPFNFGEDGKITFQPEDSDWVFSAAVRYGHSSTFKHVDHQTGRVSSVPFKYGTGVSITTVEKFSNTQEHRNESYAILDFAAGKDFGLGLFGKNGSSILSLGVRFAQFSSNATFDVRARPDLRTKPKYYGTYKIPGNPNVYFHTYHATGRAARSFHGIGPSLSWTGSSPFAGNPQHGEMMVDWGANAALLFGKQRARVQHQESGHYESRGNTNAPYSVVYDHLPTGHDTIRSVIVPNVGGFAGLSYRIENFKVSAGYRTDFFFGAIDGGIDERKSENVGFYGPFATISVGLGG